MIAPEANSRITINYYIVVSDGVHIYTYNFILLMYFKHNGMYSTKKIRQLKRTLTTSHKSTAAVTDANTGKSVE